MPTAPDQQQAHPEVSTEPQRQALDEMSRQLVEKLNDMVREQNERAEHFAATQHSLSALPTHTQQADIPNHAARGMLPPTPQPPAPQPRHAAKVNPLPLLPTQQPEPPIPQAEEPSKPQAKSFWEQNRPEWLPEAPAGKQEKKGEENGCGSGTIITLIIIVLIIIRSCS